MKAIEGGLNPLKQSTIALAYKRRVVPLVWSVHRSSRGHTSATEQIRLFASVSELMPVHSEVWMFYD